MKKTAVVLNIARGDIINEKDFYHALKNKLIGGGIIDTWYKYPSYKNAEKFSPSSYDYHKLDNIVMTPHISAWSEEMIIRRSRLIAKNIENFYNDKKLINQIN